MYFYVNLTHPTEWGRKAENKAKAQHSTHIIPSKLIAELQHSDWLGKTFPGG